MAATVYMYIFFKCPVLKVLAYSDYLMIYLYNITKRKSKHTHTHKDKTAFKKEEKKSALLLLVFQMGKT